eukprot:1564310-Rhodomonas_salina.1
MGAVPGTRTSTLSVRGTAQYSRRQVEESTGTRLLGATNPRRPNTSSSTQYLSRACSIIAPSQYQRGYAPT